ncbi:MAG: monofunctional biosynthetic peptidoglycan transglycosylase [Neisseria sp.]|nr:monofunctional biosynthetic peptidoglycan transglycosylase [Neisseria sp.]
MLKIIKYMVLLPLVVVLGFNAFAYGSVLFYRAFYPHQTTFMQLRMWEAERGVKLDYRPVAYDRISLHLKKALIVSEDAGFADHDGFDWKGIQTALKKNERSGRVRAGGSTISQQLAKNLLLVPARNMWRKGEEALITAMLEATTDKDRIFALYLNVIEWGEGLFGAEAAAQYYFHKPAQDLTRQEAAQLAAMVTRPLYYQDHRNHGRLRYKTNIILRRMGAAQLPE